MIIIYGVNDHQILPRLLTHAIDAALEAMPVVVVTGARQTGKSTLVRELLPERDRRYMTLDDLDVLEQATESPDQLVTRAKRLTLDEVQRAPDVLLTVKRAVDKDRKPGRFILTGSANLLLMQRVSETLAGRATYLTLWPLTRREQLGWGRAGMWTELFGTEPENWPKLLGDAEAKREDWRSLARRGGYPTPAYEIGDPAARSRWFSGYTRTYLERDLQELSSIAGLIDFRRLMVAACLRLGQLVNQTELGRDVGLQQPTVRRYLNLLETSYQLVRLPAYSVNRTKRLIKTPKLYWADTALALSISDVHEPGGPHLENLILTDLLAWRDSRVNPPSILYWRTTTGEEVDFVIEWRARLLPVEVKASRNVRFGDSRHLRSFLNEYPTTAHAGLLLYAGDETFWLTEKILAAPWWRVI